MSDFEFLNKYSIVKKALEYGETHKRAAEIGKCGMGTVQKVEKLISRSKNTSINESYKGVIRINAGHRLFVKCEAKSADEAKEIIEYLYNVKIWVEKMAKQN